MLLYYFKLLYNMDSHQRMRMDVLIIYMYEWSIILNEVGEFAFDECKQEDCGISPRRIVESIFGVDTQGWTREPQKKGVHLWCRHTRVNEGSPEKSGVCFFYVGTICYLSQMDGESNCNVTPPIFGGEHLWVAIISTYKCKLFFQESLVATCTCSSVCVGWSSNACIQCICLQH